MSELPSRRAVLAAAALTAAAVPTLAACGRKHADVPSSGTDIAALDDVPDGETTVIYTPAGDPVVLTRSGDTVTALSGVCTHQSCSVRMEPDYILCPCHNSKFNADGTVISGPAPDPLPAIAVEVVDGRIVVA